MRPPDRVLVAHREEAARESLATACSEAGFDAARAGDATTLQAADTFHPALVLLDGRLPGAEGALVALRESGVVVIAVSALEEVSGRLQMLLAGAEDTLIWPTHAAEVAARVRTVLLMRRYRARLAAAERELHAMRPAPPQPSLRGLLGYEMERARRYRHPLSVAAWRLEDAAKAGPLADLARSLLRAADRCVTVGATLVVVLAETAAGPAQAAVDRVAEAAERAGMGRLATKLVAVEVARAEVDADAILDALGLGEPR